LPSPSPPSFVEVRGRHQQAERHAEQNRAEAGQEDDLGQPLEKEHRRGAGRRERGAPGQRAARPGHGPTAVKKQGRRQANQPDAAEQALLEVGLDEDVVGVAEHRPDRQEVRLVQVAD
jgi:hypothetical protein